MVVRIEPVSTTFTRKTRRPEHTFQLRTRPWQIQPFLLAPVLPGETMKSLMMQSRVVTDPVISPLLGWWMEHYFFYVKHRDLDGRDDFTAMMLELDKDMSGYHAAADVKYYHGANTIPWAKLCLKRVVEEYFRDEGEAWDAATIDGLPVAKLEGPGWMDSLVTDANYVAPDDVDLDLNADNALMASEVEQGMRQWQFMRLHNLTEMSYEDFLRSYGVRAARVEIHRPELVRYSRNWSYPSATVNPSDGVPSNAVVWSIAERADKDRYFTEPGFLFGVCVARPKVYFKGQTTNVADHMMSALAWLPPQLTNDLSVSLKKFAAGAGPVGGATEPYWLDVRDLLLYGDQFLNFDLAATDAGLVAKPSVSLQHRFGDGTDADALFAYAGADPARKEVRQDGIVMLNVLSPQRDQT